MNAPVGAIDGQSKKCFELCTSRNTFFVSFLRFSGGFSLVGWVRPFKKRPPAGVCFEGQYLLGGRGSQGRLVTGRACHFEKKEAKIGWLCILS